MYFQDAEHFLDIKMPCRSCHSNKFWGFFDQNVYSIKRAYHIVQLHGIISINILTWLDRKNILFSITKSVKMEVITPIHASGTNELTYTDQFVDSPSLKGHS